MRKELPGRNQGNHQPKSPESNKNPNKNPKGSKKGTQTKTQKGNPPINDQRFLSTTRFRQGNHSDPTRRSDENSRRLRLSMVNPYTCSIHAWNLSRQGFAPVEFGKTPAGSKKRKPAVFWGAKKKHRNGISSSLSNFLGAAVF